MEMIRVWVRLRVRARVRVRVPAKIRVRVEAEAMLARGPENEFRFSIKAWPVLGFG